MYTYKREPLECKNMWQIIQLLIKSYATFTFSTPLRYYVGQINENRWGVGYSQISRVNWRSWIVTDRWISIIISGVRQFSVSIFVYIIDIISTTHATTASVFANLSGTELWQKLWYPCAGYTVIGAWQCTANLTGQFSWGRLFLIENQCLRHLTF